ncbi:anthranilate synthase component I family protein [Krasilnikovia cinnamomea]|uniref:anthranilate synthase component I family protein n=1 Tax=Krasilnikovia cinnamomea TaxID=349313 RepID=UPI001F5E6FA9|nr:anthranilate synthase component I family protein [Krasilnikovia cinnamomea]
MHVVPLPPVDPLALYATLAAQRPAGDLYLLESLDGPDQDRHGAMLGWDRLAELRFVGDRLELHTSGALGAALAAVADAVLGVRLGQADGVRTWRVAGPDTVWSTVRALTGALALDTEVPVGAFAFGFLTTFAYEAAWDMDTLPPNPAADQVARLTLTLFRNTVWWDLDTGTVSQLVSSGPLLDAGSTPLVTDLLAGAVEPAGTPAAPAPHWVRDSVDAETFQARVKECLGFIEVGDSYQIQIGHRIEVASDLAPLDVYRRLRERSPSPYMYLLPWAGETVIGASPELFLKIQDGSVVMRPIAGTVPRAADPESDRARVAELVGSDKERAEHVMLVDLCRNDIGRICVPGTLSVDSMMRAEPFAYVHHLVSTVSGRLEDGVDVWDAVCAAFPAGTMTGAPKLRAMEIIQSIEDSPRGIYAGALGLLDPRGYAIFALCIRTAVHDGRVYRTQASAGVVADSTPGGEWRETLAKMSATYWALTGSELLA